VRFLVIASRNLRAALIASACTLPIVVIVAFALAAGSGSGTAQSDATAVVSVAAPTPSSAAIEPCAQVLSALPVQLDGHNPRQVHPYPDEGAPAVAWGDPAIVLQCGVARPAQLTEGSTANVFLVDAVNWLPVATANATVFTAVDRAVYIAVTVPKSYQQPPLATLSQAIATVVPAVCHFPADTPTASASPTAGTVGPLCTHRP
jgi:Protein of unknown function (DUF3515)